MENHSLDQAREVKKMFQDQNLTDSLKHVINGIGICAVQSDPEVYGIAINLSESVEHAEILAYFPPELHENVLIKTVGLIRHR